MSSGLRKAGSSPHKKPQLCWRRPLMVRQPYSVAVWAPFLSPTRGSEGVVKTIERAVGTSPVPWGERLCKWAQWKFAFILPSAANLLHEKRGLGKEVDPPLRLREDWWVFESPNYFYFFECQESTCRLSKNLLSIKRGFSKVFFKPYFLKNSLFFNYK